MLLNYLKENYEVGEPIFTTDIKIPNLSEKNLRYHLRKLTEDGIICRFEPGVYYFPKTNHFGEKIELSPDTVVLNKYILKDGKRIGYYSGHTLANRLGLSTQVPFIQEIVSNNAPAPYREINVGNRKFILRKPTTEINDKNVYTLQLLDCLKDIDKCAEESLLNCGEILTNFATKHKITKDMINEFIEQYPIKIYKSIYDTEVKYVSTQQQRSF